MIKTIYYAMHCYSLLFYRIIRPELIVWTAGHSTLLTVLKDDFFCVFTSVFDLSNWSICLAHLTIFS